MSVISSSSTYSSFSESDAELLSSSLHHPPYVAHNDHRDDGLDELDADHREDDDDLLNEEEYEQGFDESLSRLSMMEDEFHHHQHELFNGEDDPHTLSEAKKRTLKRRLANIFHRGVGAGSVSCSSQDLFLCGSVFHTTRIQQQRMEYIKKRSIQQLSNHANNNGINNPFNNTMSAFSAATSHRSVDIEHREEDASSALFYKSLPFGENIRHISCGSNHYMILTESGRLFCSGRNDFGQLGIPETLNRRLEGSLLDLNARLGGNLNATSLLSASNDNTNGLNLMSPRDYTPAVSPRTTVVNNQAQPIIPEQVTLLQKEFNPHPDLELNFLVECNLSLLIPAVENIGKPVLPKRRASRVFSRMNDLQNHFGVRLVSCGSNHTIIVTNNGDLYSTGANVDGQLGLGDFCDRFIFSKINVCLEQPIQQLHCQFNHSAIITTRGELYVCGSNANAETGLLLPKAKVSVFSQVPINVPVKSIRFTMDSTVVLSTDGDLYSCGIGGELNNDQNGDNSSVDEKRFTMYRKMSIIPSFKKVNINNEKFEQIHCGATFTLAATTNDEVFVFNNGSTSSGEEYSQSPRYNTSSSTSVMDHYLSYRQSMLLPSKNGGTTATTKPFKTFRLKAKENDDIPFTTKIKDICCGHNHVIITDYLDQFYGLGRNDDGRLGFPSKRPDHNKKNGTLEKKPIYVNDVKRVEFSNRYMQSFNSVACGEKFTIFYNKREDELVELQKRKQNPLPLKPLFTKRVHTLPSSGTCLNVFHPLLQQLCPSLASCLSTDRSLNVQPSDVPLLQLLIDSIINEEDIDQDVMDDGSKLLRLLYLLSVHVKLGEQVDLKLKILWKLLDLISMENVNTFLQDIVSCMEEMDRVNTSSSENKINSAVLKKLNDYHETILIEIAKSCYKWMFLLGEYCKDLLDMSLGVKSELAQQLVKRKLPNMFKQTSLAYSVIVRSELQTHNHLTSPLGAARKSLYNHQETSDIKVALNHHRANLIHAHKTILASCSPVLDSFLRKQHESTHSAHTNSETLDLYSLCFGTELHLLNRNFTQKSLELSLQYMYDVYDTNLDMNPLMDPKEGIDLFFCIQIVALKLQSNYLQQKGFEILELFKKNLADDHTISLVERSLDFVESYKLQDPFKEDFTRAIVKIVNDKWPSLSARCRSRSDWKYILQLFYNFVEEEQYYDFL
ncbi:hypothetical protein C9374_012677 [Naegleria lovaniensis]|uniref:BTB domain-containing protein n=1 Tax=Naegleria lovaniensis TaxID=51637 RepID=A0AA88KWA3_NAELO|nr:uncharacterized protein C9374_012677 [Naegleria lovaniensis]KAG2392425.1 hypothetical protein C9374_012677 [Naegleria lovaniensis]